jgi:hypothetical protein
VCARLGYEWEVRSVRSVRSMLSIPVISQPLSQDSEPSVPPCRVVGRPITGQSSEAGLSLTGEARG